MLICCFRDYKDNSDEFVRTALKEYSLKNTVPYVDSIKRVNGKILPVNGMHVSVSHTGSFIAVAVSDIPVGIDAENTDRVISDKLKKKLAPLGAEAKEFFFLWCRAEARAKLTGEPLLKILKNTNDEEISYADIFIGDILIVAASKGIISMEIKMCF